MNFNKLYKGQITTYLILIICVIVAMVMLRQCSHKIPHQLDYIRAGGDTINVAIEISPLSLSMSGDSLNGFNYELLNLISNQYGIKFKMHAFIPINYALEGLKNNLFDIVIADIQSTSEFKQNFLLTESVYIDRQVLVQRKDSTSGNVAIKEHRQLASDTIWVVANSPVIGRITNLAQEMGCDTIYIMKDSVHSSEHLVILTAIGEIKQTVVNEKIAKSVLKEYPQLDINTKISFNQFQSWALNKNNVKLHNEFNIWLNEIKTTTQYQELITKYFN